VDTDFADAGVRSSARLERECLEGVETNLGLFLFEFFCGELWYLIRVLLVFRTQSWTIASFPTEPKTMKYVCY
jgi:hypothetical protein